MLLIIFLTCGFMLIFLLMSLFFFTSKTFNWDKNSSSSFECGFTSYFFSRYSFSMHYYIIGMIFLILDLELCFIMPFFNGAISNPIFYFLFFLYVLFMILGLMAEWKMKKMEWKF